jgi:hypothetical protein
MYCYININCVISNPYLENKLLRENKLFYCRIVFSIQILFVSGRFLHASAAAFIIKSLIVIPRDLSFESFDFDAVRSLSFLCNLIKYSIENELILISTYLRISSNSISIFK